MRVLLALDLQSGAEGVLEQGKAWADRIQATVDLVYVASWSNAPLYIDEPAVRAVVDQQYEEARRESQRTLEGLLQQLPEARRGRAVVVDGSPGRTLAAMAEKYDAVIVGTHGRSGLNHLFLGSVAERVVRFSPVPVLVLKVGEA